MITILAAIVLTAWLVVAGVACLSAHRAQRERKGPFVLGGSEKSVLIIPVRGVPPHLAEMWRGIGAQSYRPSRVIFGVESADDPACAALRALAGGPPLEIVVAGPTTKRAQKVHNMLAALAALKDSDETVIFADADIVPTEHWLARLTKWRIGDDSVDAVSGYRWLLPTDNRWSTAFIAAINASVATTTRIHRLNLAWGGSIVLSRKAIAALQLERYWDHAVLDDLPLTRAVWAHGGIVRSPRDALLRSPVSYSWREGIAFGRRQYLFLRLHMPLHWTIAAATVTVPVVGWLVALPLAAAGDPGALSVIGAAIVLNQARAHFRAQVPHKILGAEIPARAAQLDRWGTPLVVLFHAVLIWSTLFGRRIVWASRIYRVDGRGQVMSIQEPEQIPRR